MKYSCIIVEDEPLSAEILTDYIKQVPFLELRTVCVDAIYAMEILKKEKIDLLSLREYVRITTKEKNILTKFPLSRIEELLSKNNFLRIHRSFIVAKDKISAFTNTDVEINNKQIPIGRSYKESVLAILE